MKSFRIHGPGFAIYTTKRKLRNLARRQKVRQVDFSIEKEKMGTMTFGQLAIKSTISTPTYKHLIYLGARYGTDVS
jgi:hypothetical protein